MRTSSNPAFRNLPTSPGGYARFGDAPAGYGGTGSGGGYPGIPTPAGATDRPITVDDVVQKTAVSAAVALGAGVVAAFLGLGGWGVLGGIGVGLVLALIIIFGRKANAPLVLAYSAAEGVGLGSITGALESSPFGNYAGIGLQAIMGVAGIFIGMLVVYKTGAIRVTPRLTKMVIGAAIGVLVLMLGNLVVGLVAGGDGLGLRSGGTLAIVFSLVCIAIGAFMLLLDFDQADQAVQAGVPARFAWYLAFGFMTTLVWLYIEILRLLTYFRQ